VYARSRLCGTVTSAVLVSATIAVIAVAAFLVFTPGTLTQGSSPHGPSLRVGDYALFTGNGVVGNASEHEMARYQVVAINSSGVEWVQNSTVNGESSLVFWVAPVGVSPFHFSHANDTFTFEKSYDASQSIGSESYRVTVSVYLENGEYTNTYYYIKGTGLIPIEFTGRTLSKGPAVAESFYLTSTDIQGLATVDPNR
jgi:hypothetical protein